VHLALKMYKMFSGHLISTLPPSQSQFPFPFPVLSHMVVKVSYSFTALDESFILSLTINHSFFSTLATKSYKYAPINFSVSVVLSVHLCSCKSLRTAKEIFIKCDAMEFSLKIHHTESDYHITIMDILCEDLHVFLAALSVPLAKKTLF